jgi:hypothetical protein
MQFLTVQSSGSECTNMDSSVQASNNRTASHCSHHDFGSNVLHKFNLWDPGTTPHTMALSQSHLQQQQIHDNAIRTAQRYL